MCPFLVQSLLLTPPPPTLTPESLLFLLGSLRHIVKHYRKHVTHFTPAAQWTQNATSKDLFPMFNLNLIESPAMEASTTADEVKSFLKYLDETWLVGSCFWRSSDRHRGNSYEILADFCFLKESSSCGESKYLIWKPPVLSKCRRLVRQPFGRVTPTS